MCGAGGGGARRWWSEGSIARKMRVDKNSQKDASRQIIALRSFFFLSFFFLSFFLTSFFLPSFVSFESLGLSDYDLRGKKRKKALLKLRRHHFQSCQTFFCFSFFPFASGKGKYVNMCQSLTNAKLSRFVIFYCADCGIQRYKGEFTRRLGILRWP